jgi:HPt (histidine-containing phosphotransfer) domain-containing protein
MESIRAYESQDSAPVDIDDLLGRCLGRIELAERILRTFQTSLDSDLKKLEAAVSAFDATEIAHLAHRIKGASLAVSAHKLTECAKSIELSASARRLDEIPEYLAKLKSESARLDDLNSMFADSSTC